MIEVLGMELEEAKALLAREGINCACTEISSRKGVVGNEMRVLRVRQTGDNSVELICSVFLTDVDYISSESE